MGIGPFDTFSFPNVYTQTLNEPPRPTAAGELRFAAFIGVAEEVIPVNNYEMIRGSSAMADNKIVRENVSSQVTGTNRDFQVSYYPIVSGDGSGTVTNDPTKVTVYVNGESVPVASVDGANGKIYVVSIPAIGDEVLITYYFKKTDTLHENEDLSNQVDGVRKTFRVHNYPIVQGDNSGITTTDPSRIIVKVDNNVVSVLSVDGDSGQFTLATAPAVGSVLTVTYYSNEEQDTSDILPSPYVNSVTKVGYAPGTSDFIKDVDFVLDTTGAFHTINWGHSFKIASGAHTIGAEYFDDSQISCTLYDNRVFRRLATGKTDGTNKSFVLEAPPMTGQGLGKQTEDPSKLIAYIGTSPTDATAVDVTEISGNTITLQTPPPAPTGPDGTVYVYATQYINLLPDDRWTLKCMVAGPANDGTYSISGVNSGTAMEVRWSAADSSIADTDFVSENVTYPNGTGPGNCDAQVMPGYAVAETVTLTFVGSAVDATAYVVTSNNPNGTGSAGDNTGYLNQTYIDRKTGFRVTINKGTLVTYVAGDYLGYTVSPNFTVGSQPTRAIPGLRVTVDNTINVGVGDTALINTYNKSGSEPRVGDFYYVSFTEDKQFNSNGFIKAKLYTREKDVIADTGPLTINNKVGVAAHLAFLNATSALAIMQIKRSEGYADAPDSRYIAAIDSFNEPMEGGYRPSLLEPVTTSIAVINYLKNSNVIQSSIRYANERMSYFGFPINTSPTQAQLIARSLNCERMIGIYPDGAVTTLVDELGNEVEYLVDGAMLAAAVAGRDTSPAYDVAEPLTRKPIVGFKRLYRRMDSVTAAQTANAGLTLIEEQAAGMVVKFGLTTDVSSVLTRTPSVVRIKDFVQKGARSVLQPFIGSKYLPQRTNEIETTLTAYLQALKTASIITEFTGVKATPDPNDPTIVRVEAFYSPVLPLLWIVITFNLRSAI